MSDDRIRTTTENPGEDTGPKETLLGELLLRTAAIKESRAGALPATARPGVRLARRHQTEMPGIARHTPDPADAAPLEPPVAPEVDMARLESSPASILDGTTRTVLARELAQPIPPVRVHHHHYAMQVLRRFGADALTVEHDVLLPAARLSGARPEDRALLGHELTHAAQRHLEPHNREETSSEAVRAEEQALDAEVTMLVNNAVLSAGSPPLSMTETRILGPAPPQPAAVADAAPVVSPSARPLSIKAASQERKLGQIPAPQAGRATPRLSPEELRRLKEEMYSYLMERIREDFERGG